MQNHYTHALEQAIINWPNVKTPHKQWGDDFRDACTQQLALYLKWQWRLQTGK